MTTLFIGIVIGIVVRHFWTPLRIWLVHTAWPWLASRPSWLMAKLSGETR